jgi:predicted metal-dependent enzyme (double-stranded beta helix superfamily)
VSAPEIASVSRPRGGDLGELELQLFVEELAARPELWIGLVSHDPAQRRYAELFADAHVTAWLICWMDDHDTGFHDHDASAGAVAVLSGGVREQRLVLEGPPLERRFRAGEAFHFSATDIHRLTHTGGEPAVTLHAYSPPLLRMGAYNVGESGLLERRPMAASEELRPLAAAPGERPPVALA